VQVVPQLPWGLGLGLLLLLLLPQGQGLCESLPAQHWRLQRAANSCVGALHTSVVAVAHLLLLLLLLLLALLLSCYQAPVGCCLGVDPSQKLPLALLLLYCC
jgi:hypothetical protein